MAHISNDWLVTEEGILQISKIAFIDKAPTTFGFSKTRIWFSCYTDEDGNEDNFYVTEPYEEICELLGIDLEDK